MIDIERFARVLSERYGKKGLVLAGCCEMPRMVCEDLYKHGAIGGFVADERPPRGCSHAIAGWWTDHGRSRWRLHSARAEVIAFCGHELQINARMLLTAWRSGYRRIYVAGADVQGASGVEIDVPAVLGPRLYKAAVRRFVALPPVRNTIGTLGVRSLTYEAAFEDLLDCVGDALRISPDTVHAGRMVMLLGSLGPGGAERQAVVTAVGLSNRGKWRPIIGCSFIDGDINGFHRDKAESNGVDVMQVPAHSPRFNEPVIQRALQRSQRFQHLGFQNLAYVILNYACFLADQRPAVVQTWMDYCNVLGGIAAHLAGIPGIVLSGRSVAPDHFSLFQPYMRPGYLCLLRHRQTAAITNNSLAGAADYARWLKLPTDRFEVIHNGFEFPALSLTASSIAVRDSLGIPHDALVLGAIMRFSEEKCPYLWIQAAERVVRQVPQVRCVIFGSGVLHDDIRRTVLNLGLGDRILLPGITRDAWASLACMDVFMLTSRMEGLPNVLIEAQSVGVPVVTTGQGGMRETYSEGVTGWTASSPTPDALAAATVPLLLDGAKRTRASQAAREFVRTRFNAMKMIEATSRLFDRTIHHDHTTTHLPLRQPTDP